MSHDCWEGRSSLPALLESEDTSCTKSSVLSKGKACRNLGAAHRCTKPTKPTKPKILVFGWASRHSGVPFPPHYVQQHSMCIPLAMKLKEQQSKQRSLLLHQAGLLLQVVSLGAFQGLVVSTQTAEMLSTLHHYRVNFRPAACHSRQKHCWLTHLCRFFCSK